MSRFLAPFTWAAALACIAGGAGYFVGFAAGWARACNPF